MPPRNVSFRAFQSNRRTNLRTDGGRGKADLEYRSLYIAGAGGTLRPALSHELSFQAH